MVEREQVTPAPTTRGITMIKLLYRIPEAAELVGLGRSKLYEEMAAGRLAFVKVGTRRLIPGDALIAYVEMVKLEAEGSAA